MKISVFGLGYVGAVTAACFARDGHEIVGVDVNPDKVALIAEGVSPIVEAQLSELLAEGVAQQRITATTDAHQAVRYTEASLVSVGTPPTPHGSPNLDYVYAVCREIGGAVRQKGQPHVVVLRSTVPPGTLECCRKILEESAGDVAVHVAFNPEFLREGAAIKDYYAPPYTIIGTEDPVAEEAVRAMYASVDAQVIVVKPAVAEMLKYIANSWHAVKITFANEVGRIAKAFEVDGREVMSLIVQDTKLNVSPAYMRPGFAYGGSCLPKDLGSLLHFAQAKNVSLPLLNAVPVSNNIMIDEAVRTILQAGARKVAVFGLAFKPGTDDLRESPAVPMIKRLLGEGCTVQIFDPSVYEARLMGTNLAYIQANLPHFERLLKGTAAEALQDVDTAVVTYSTPAFSDALSSAPKGIKVVDLAGLFTEVPEGVEYYGLAW